MSTEDMIFELRRLYEKHKNDPVYTGETSWALLCRDVADRLEELEGRCDRHIKYRLDCPRCGYLWWSENPFPDCCPRCKAKR